MSKYISLICPNCRRTLNVRKAYLGRSITCNRCEHCFHVREGDGPPLSKSSAEFATLGSPDLSPTDASRDSAPAEAAEVTGEVERLLGQVRVLSERVAMFDQV